MTELIFEKSVPGRHGAAPPQCDVPRIDPAELLGGANLRAELPLPEMSELDVVRHYTRLSHRNYGIDVGFYPLGSCTMKYNPRMHEAAARMPGFARVHPLQPEEHMQGALGILHVIQGVLAEIAGMDAATVQPAAGAHGELLALMMVRDYHRARGDAQRDTILVPDSAHGTNPASAARCGFKVRAVPSNAQGVTHPDALESRLDGRVAAMMLTNPNTAGLFETHIEELCGRIHAHGGLVYCDGANMNALVGVARPGDMGFDVMHFNLHKTFSTPHGGGGPGCGAVAVKSMLEPYLPVPVVTRRADGTFFLDSDRPDTVGRIHSFYGAFLVAVRAYAYIRSLGAEGLRQTAEAAVLNANYVRRRLEGAFEVAHDRLCMHEVVLSASRQKARSGVRALDISKRLMDYGFHPPTNYFPLIVPEALMIEPTETESRQTLDAFCEAMLAIAADAEANPELVRTAPHTTVISRLDETAAVKQLDVAWQPPESSDPASP